MDQGKPIKTFRELSRRYDHLFGPGAALELKDKLELGCGRFNVELTTEEIRELNQELEDRLAEIQ